MRIVLLGTGNLATRLGIALHAKNAEIVQVYGRNASKASHLAKLLGCTYTSSRKKITVEADIYVLTVSDEAIMDVLSGLSISNQLVVHTAGSVPMDVLAPFSKNIGVVYPLQTLSKNKEIDFENVPICIEANTNANLEKLKELAGLLSEQVLTIDSIKRRQLHLAAVFVCNFVNHFYTIGEKLLQEAQLDFDLLKPIILETANKAMQFSPLNVQTGPAVRDDIHIMEQHLKMLAQHPEWHKLYELVSEDIRTNRRGDPQKN
jgi:predicted short-subunit dehydrogenase-like oxidoreductase (DUF2520 family)